MKPLDYAALTASAIGGLIITSSCIVMAQATAAGLIGVLWLTVGRM